MAKPRPLPLGADLSPTIERMRQIAAESGDHLYLSDGPPHPDAALLDLCSEILQTARLAEEARRLREETCVKGFVETNRPWTDEIAQLDKVRMAEWRRLDTQVMLLSRKARKMRATTPAGIFAKALIVRLSKTGAALLAMGLAEELIDCQELRRSLWPAQTTEAL